MPSDSFLLTHEQLRTRGGAKWRKHPADVLPAWVADMDFAVAPAVQETIARLLQRNDYGYGAVEDPQRLVDAFARRMDERYGWAVDPELVQPQIDVVQGLVAGLCAFTQPGDGVVVQTPIYPPFLMSIANTGRRLVENPLIDDGRCFVVDPDRLRSVIDAGTRLILLCNPHNPTGRVLTRKELESIAAVALEHDLVIVSDEIHADLVYSPARHVPMASLGPEVAERTVTLTSATKAFNIAGLRCSVAAFGGPRLRDRFKAAIPDHLLGGPNRFGVEATIAAWTHGGEWLDSVIGYLDRNRRRVAEAASQIEGIRHHSPEGTYLAWLDCTRLELPLASPYEFFLERAKVGLSDGTEFGTPGRGCVRLNFATSSEILEAILDRMAAALQTVTS